MKYSIGNYVRKNSTPNDLYMITYTKEDKEMHSLLKNGFDYLIQKQWDYDTKDDVKHATLEPVNEEDIYV